MSIDSSSPELRVRKTTAADVALSNEWRLRHKVPDLQPDALPPTGVVCVEGENPLAMAWLYISNSKLAYLAWPVTAPGLGPRKARQALRLACKHQVDLALVLGIKYIVATSSSRGLSKIFEECGLIKGPLSHDLLTMEVR